MNIFLKEKVKKQRINSVKYVCWVVLFDDI